MTDIENDAVKELDRVTKMTEKWFYSYYDYKDLQNYLKIVLKLVKKQKNNYKRLVMNF